MARSTAVLAVELVALLVAVTFAVQLFQRRMGPERIRAVMGGSPAVAALKGTGIGFVTPFCTYSAIPMLIGLRQAQVPPAGYVAFIVAAPVLDPILFGALVVIIGLEAALLYMAVAFTAAISLALAAQTIGIERHLKPVDVVLSAPVGAPAPVSVGGGSDGPSEPGCGDAGQWLGWPAESAAAWSSALAFLRSMLPLLALGIGVGLAIEMLVDAETAARMTGEHEFFAIPIAAALGTPLYINTELYVPIADSLREAGVATGAIVALTIAGAGANIPEFVLLSKIARGPTLVIFMGYVFGVAIVGGLLSAALL